MEGPAGMLAFALPAGSKSTCRPQSRRWPATWAARPLAHWMTRPTSFRVISVTLPLRLLLFT